MKRARVWALSGAAAAIFFAAIGVATHDEPQDVANDVAEATTQAQVRAQIDASAQRLCNAEVGPGSTVLWTHDGDLVCRPAFHVATKGSTP